VTLRLGTRTPLGLAGAHGPRSFEINSKGYSGLAHRLGPIPQRH
jgi:hypothetical protein